MYLCVAILLRYLVLSREVVEEGRSGCRIFCAVYCVFLKFFVYAVLATLNSYHLLSLPPSPEATDTDTIDRSIDVAMRAWILTFR